MRDQHLLTDNQVGGGDQTCQVVEIGDHSIGQGVLGKVAQLDSIAQLRNGHPLVDGLGDDIDRRGLLALQGAAFGTAHVTHQQEGAEPGKQDGPADHQQPSHALPPLSRLAARSQRRGPRPPGHPRRSPRW